MNAMTKKNSPPTNGSAVEYQTLAINEANQKTQRKKSSYNPTIEESIKEAKDWVDFLQL